MTIGRAKFLSYLRRQKREERYKNEQKRALEFRGKLHNAGTVRTSKLLWYDVKRIRFGWICWPKKKRGDLTRYIKHIRAELKLEGVIVSYSTVYEIVREESWKKKKETN